MGEKSGGGGWQTGGEETVEKPACGIAVAAGVCASLPLSAGWP